MVHHISETRVEPGQPRRGNRQALINSFFWPCRYCPSCLQRFGPQLKVKRLVRWPPKVQPTLPHKEYGFPYTMTALSQILLVAIVAFLGVRSLSIPYDGFSRFSDIVQKQISGEEDTKSIYPPVPVLYASTTKSKSGKERLQSSSRPTCSVASSAPSIAPRRLTSADGHQDTSPYATIDPNHSTLFEYTIPEAFFSPSTQQCALQFRLPFCDELPSGYPCFTFSGSEQELLSNSGMVFDLIQNAEIPTWNDTAVDQIYPGDRTIFGTFECGSEFPYGSRTLSWLVSSASEFVLDFMQGGMDPKFPDGVGAWIVPCS